MQTVVGLQLLDRPFEAKIASRIINGGVIRFDPPGIAIDLDPIYTR